jgi:hypothetical protein
MICHNCNRDLGPAKTKKAKDAEKLGVSILCELCAKQLIEEAQAILGTGRTPDTGLSHDEALEPHELVRMLEHRLAGIVGQMQRYFEVSGPHVVSFSELRRQHDEVTAELMRLVDSPSDTVLGKTATPPPATEEAEIFHTSFAEATAELKAKHAAGGANTKGKAETVEAPVKALPTADYNSNGVDMTYAAEGADPLSERIRQALKPSVGLDGTTLPLGVGEAIPKILTLIREERIKELERLLNTASSEQLEVAAGIQIMHGVIEARIHQLNNEVNPNE